MRILFAASDRDLLLCYRQLLEADLGETVTVFDGLQVLSTADRESFDVAVVDSHLQRVAPAELAGYLKSRGVPLIVLSDQKSGDKSADACLCHPFSEEDLVKTIKTVVGEEK